MIRTKLLGILCFAIVSTGLAQQPNPQTPEDAFTTRDLIAWSQLQRPQPAPQPIPRENQVPQPEPRDQQAKSPADPHIQQEPAQSFTGKIVREGERYLLLLADNTNYQLEQDGSFMAYESRNVRVLGFLNTDNKTIRAVNVQVLS